jgi:hypothetical protein
MTKTFLIARILKRALLCLLLASVAGFLTFLNAYGVFLASVTALIAFSVYKNHRFGYFAAAAWGLACFQLAKQGYEFQEVKRQVMFAGFIVVPVALFLHEILAKPNAKNARKSVTKETDSRNMPQ